MSSSSTAFRNKHSKYIRLLYKDLLMPLVAILQERMGNSRSTWEEMNLGKKTKTCGLCKAEENIRNHKTVTGLGPLRSAWVNHCRHQGRGEGGVPRTMTAVKGKRTRALYRMVTTHGQPMGPLGLPSTPITWQRIPFSLLCQNKGKCHVIGWRIRIV